MDFNGRGLDDGDSGRSEIPGEEEVIAEIEAISLTPSEHQRVKDLLNGGQMNRIKGYDRRYLVVGAGGETGAATRRKIVYDLLDARTDPSAAAMRLEDFGLTPEEIRLWTRVFAILRGRATHIVGVIEDFDGGYVWELGLLFALLFQPVRQCLTVVLHQWIATEAPTPLSILMKQTLKIVKTRIKRPALNLGIGLLLPTRYDTNPAEERSSRDSSCVSGNG